MKSLLQDFLTAIWVVIKLPFLIIEVLFRRIVRTGAKKLILRLIAVLVLTLVLAFTFLKITSKPGFCGSCHIMRPYIEAWEHSTHKDVDCMMCHAREGIGGYLETKFTAASMLVNYATGLYKRSRPWAEIEDKNCLHDGCHETRLLEGKIEFTQGVVFDHAPHLTGTRRGRTLRCTSCHSQIVQGEHISVTSSTCFLCHFKNVEAEGRDKLADCESCHTPPTGENAIEGHFYDHTDAINQELQCGVCHQMMWQGSGNVPRERCGTCHSSTAHIDRISDLEFIHEWHIEKRKVDCNRCHDVIEHRIPKIEADVRSNCAGCHDDKHMTVSNLYQGKGSRLVEGEHPDPMYTMRVVCVSCHKEIVNGDAIPGATQKTCNPCHPASYLRLADDWKKGFSNRIAQLNKGFKKAGPHPLLEDARHDLGLVDKGGAWHNPIYSDNVLTKVSEVLAEAGVTTSKVTNLPDESKQCLLCHSSIQEVPVKKEYSSFNHTAHLRDRKIVCTTCHFDERPGNPRHGKRKGSQELCTDCHHNQIAQKNDSCDPCHQSSSKVFTGDLPGIASDPSPMAASDMGCVDCHEGPEFKAPGAEFCLDCHDEEIVTDLEYMRGEFVIGIEKSKSNSKAGTIVKLDKGRAVHHPDLAKKVLNIE
jgi:nitrate/TMAO reductase-like tetraheme cytochrome c subunit